MKKLFAFLLPLVALSAIAAAPVANFSGTPTNGQAPLTVTFTNSSTGATNYYWTFGDGDTKNLYTNLSFTKIFTNRDGDAVCFDATLVALGSDGTTNSMFQSCYVIATNPLPRPSNQQTNFQEITFVAPDLDDLNINVSNGPSLYLNSTASPFDDIGIVINAPDAPGGIHAQGFRVVNGAGGTIAIGVPSDLINGSNSYTHNTYSLTNGFGIFSNGMVTKSNIYPITALGGWGALGNSGCVPWNSNGTFYLLCTNSLGGIATTNKLGGL